MRKRKKSQNAKKEKSGWKSGRGFVRPPWSEDELPWWLRHVIKW